VTDLLGEELRPGVRTWTAHHEEWGQDVRGFAIVEPERLILVDPLLVGDQWEALEATRGERALDLLATLHYHVRSGAEIRERHPDATLWAYEGDRADIGERSPIDRPFDIGEALPGGLVAIGPLPRAEVVFWDAARAALFVGDVLLGDGAEGGAGLTMCPEPWLDGPSLDNLRAGLAPVLDLPVDLVLTAHGEPTLADGSTALQRALA
jgi:glyoxylase-like metal-dependent hydrolase (beta-lactamase superfamily II)